MNPSPYIQIRVFISGRVQGVGFRASTAREASRKKKVTGYVRNCEDGRVEVVIAGPPEEVHSLLEWCKKGPFRAKVTQVDISSEPFDGLFLDFKIL